MANFFVLDLISDTTKLLLVFVIAFLVPFLILKWLQERKYPPGPTGWPILGYLPYLGEEPHKKLWELSKKYGKIMSLYFGRSRVVIITDYKLAKEVLGNPAALARPTKPFDLIPGNGGLAGSSGEQWFKLRRYITYAMKDIGLGRGIWEHIVQEHSEEFINQIKSWKGLPADYWIPLSHSKVNNIFALFFGRPLPDDESCSDVKILLQARDSFNDVFFPFGLNAIAPFLIKYLAFLGFPRYKNLLKNFKEFEKLISKEIEARRKTKSAEEAKDLIGCFVEEMEKQEKYKNESIFTESTVAGAVLSLFAGSYDSTLISFQWLMLLMALYPDVQQKVQKEIDSTIGREKCVYWDEKEKLPYTMATIMELGRWVSLVPFLVQRMAAESFSIEGYTIPKGSWIMCNAWAIMRDPKHYKDPHGFNPEHFLTEDGKKTRTPESYLVFSYGKRDCPGKTVAMMFLFIYFVSIMQKFTIKIPDGKSTDFEKYFEEIVEPKYQQKLCFIEK